MERGRRREEGGEVKEDVEERKEGEGRREEGEDRETRKEMTKHQQCLNTDKYSLPPLIPTYPSLITQPHPHPPTHPLTQRRESNLR